VLQEAAVEAMRIVDNGAAAVYAARRAQLVGALEAYGIPARGRSGLNVWIPVPEEGPVVAGMAARGWAVAPGARYRIASPPGIRITISTLDSSESDRVASDLGATLKVRNRTRAG
jgi:DNA-binding transcriptional MocR family regulator